jgi:hypothetical protein
MARRRRRWSAAYGGGRPPTEAACAHRPRMLIRRWGGGDREHSAIAASCGHFAVYYSALPTRSASAVAVAATLAAIPPRDARPPARPPARHRRRSPEPALRRDGVAHHSLCAQQRAANPEPLHRHDGRNAIAAIPPRDARPPARPPARHRRRSRQAALHRRRCGRRAAPWQRACKTVQVQHLRHARTLRSAEIPILASRPLDFEGPRTTFKIERGGCWIATVIDSSMTECCSMHGFVLAPR